MSRITTYPIISTVASDDLLLISDISEPNKPTKTVRVGQIIASGGGGGGTGSVTSINASIGGNAVTVSGGPITISGTLAFTFGGSSAEYINGEGNLATFPSVGSGTVTAVSSTTTGDALNVAVSNSTTTPALAFSWAGGTTTYVNGVGNLALLSTIPTNLSLVVDRTAGDATLVGNVLNIPNYSGGGGGGITSITTNGTEGDAVLANSILNIPNYNKNILVFGFAVNASGTPAITIVRNTTGATFTIAADGGVVGAYNITASSAIFGSNSAGAPFTHITCQDPNIASPGQGAGSLPRQTVSRITSTTVLRIEIFKGNTGSLLGDRVAPTASDLPVTFEATIYPNTVPTPYDACATFSAASSALSASIISPSAALSKQIFMRDNGLTFYVQRHGDRTVAQASLATANDPTSTISYVNVSPTLTSIPIYKAEGLRFSSDGSKMFIGDNSSANFKIHRFILSTPWDISTASSTSDQTVSFTNGGGAYDNVTFVLSADGTKIFGFMKDFVSVDTYESIKIVLTTPYDLSTAATPVNTVLDGMFGLPGMNSPVNASGSAFFPNAVGGDDYILIGSNMSITVFANDLTPSNLVSNNGTSGCSPSIWNGWSSLDKRYLFAIKRSSGTAPFTWTLEKYLTGL